MTTDVTNHGTIATKAIESNTIKSGTDNGLSSAGDLILQANNQPTNNNVVFGTLHYNSVTPTLSFSIDTQLKGVKNPTDDQDVSTKAYVDSVGIAELSDVNLTGIANDKILKYDNATSKWIIADPRTVVQFDLGYNTNTANGATVTVGGNNGVFTNIWSTINPAGPTAGQTGFSYDTATGILTYTDATPVKVLINSLGQFSAGDAASTHIKTRLTKNGGVLRFLSSRLDPLTSAASSFNMTVTTTLTQNDVIVFDINNSNAGGTTYDMQIHALQMCIYGIY